jgi:hypothetical protein
MTSQKCCDTCGSSRKRCPSQYTSEWNNEKDFCSRWQPKTNPAVEKLAEELLLVKKDYQIRPKTMRPQTKIEYERLARHILGNYISKERLLEFLKELRNGAIQFPSIGAIELFIEEETNVK